MPITKQLERDLTQTQNSRNFLNLPWSSSKLTMRNAFRSGRWFVNFLENTSPKSTRDSTSLWKNLGKVIITHSSQACLNNSIILDWSRKILQLPKKAPKLKKEIKRIKKNKLKRNRKKSPNSNNNLPQTNLKEKPSVYLLKSIPIL